MVINKYYIPKEPNIGETYIKKRFAIFPKKIQEGDSVTIIIFQRYYKTYEYCKMWIRPNRGVRYIGEGWKLIKESTIK